jgi:hypothetical protein
VYKTPAGVLYLPSKYWLPGATPGTSLGADPSMLTNPAPGSLGDHPLRSGACSGARFTNIDMNFVKKTRIREGMTFEFRAEFFDIFNHPNFSIPSGNINNTGFGVITGTIGSPREIQLNARINF